MPFPRTYRTNAGWALSIGAILALFSNLRNEERAVVSLTLLGASGFLWSAWEHEWIRWNRKMPLRAGLILGGFSLVGWFVWPPANNSSLSTDEKSKLELEQQNVYQHLDWNVRPTTNGIGTAFRMMNNSSADLGPYQLSCRINFARFQEWHLFRNDKIVVTAAASKLRSGGDAETDSCLAGISSTTPLMCADITARFDYVLASQPDVPKNKIMRGGLHTEQGKFVWDYEPIEAKETFCN